MAGRYVLLAQLGAGGMGVVYRAYDPELRRDVAIKKLRIGTEHDDPTTRERETAGLVSRLRSEAKAMARVDHPHVLPIFDVGYEDERSAYIIMELVHGWSLAEALRLARKRSWRRRDREEVRSRKDEVRSVRGLSSWRRASAVMLQAAHGLAAAHASGVVHRDFKPDNVMVDGPPAHLRARVMDFGLAKPASDRTVLRSLSSTANERSVSREVEGTPAYMSPEQHRGELVGASSDQYSFCVGLVEVLTGRRPFQGTYLQMFRAKAHGLPTRSRRALIRAGVPRSLVKAIERGLSPREGDRHPSMLALIAAIEPCLRSPGPRAVTWVALGLIAGFGLLISRASRPAPCEAQSLRIVDPWPAARRERVRRNFDATGLAFAPRSFASASAELERYVDRWKRAHLQICRATHVEGVQSARELDHRMHCSSIRRAAARELVHRFEHADATTVTHALEAVRGLPPVDDCLGSDPDTPWMPADPRVRATTRQLAEDVAKLEVDYHAGDYPRVKRRAKGLVERAQWAGSSWFEAKIQALVSHACLQLNDIDGSLGHGDAALIAATRSHNVEAGATAAAIAMYTRGYVAQSLDDQAELVAGARARLDAAGDVPAIRSLFYNNVGVLEAARGRVAASRAAFEAGVLELRGERGPQLAFATKVRVNLAIARAFDGDPRGALEAIELAYRQQLDALGPLHPETLGTQMRLATLLARSGEWPAATVHARRGTRRCPEVYGARDSACYYMRVNGIEPLMIGGHYREAAELARSVLELERETELKVAPHHEDALSGVVRVQLARGLWAEALESSERLIARAGPEQGVAPEVLTEVWFLRGCALLHAGRLADARRAAGRSLEHAMVSRTDRQRFRALALRLGARIELEAGRVDLALEGLRHALAEALAIYGDRSEGNPNVGPWQIALAVALAQEGEFDEAETLLHQAWSSLLRVLGPGHHRSFELRLAFAELERRRGRPNAALTHLEAALRAFDSRERSGAQAARAHLELADLHWQMGAHAQAHQHIARARETLASGDADEREAEAALERWRVEHSER